MIRNVKLDDAKCIVNIYNEYIEKTTVSFETEPLTTAQMQMRIKEISSEVPYFVADEDGVIIGYAYAHRWKERAAYNKTLETTIYLDTNHRHHGVGKQLMSHLTEECKRRGYRVLIACITEENTESLAFHKHLGFKQVSCFHNVGEKFGRLLDVTDMELQL